MPSQSMKTIQERARELETKLGFTGNVGTTRPPPGQLPDPATLVTPAQWLEIWAACEAVVVKATIESFLKWIPQLTLAPIQIRGPIVIGLPGCVVGPPPLVRMELSRTRGLPQRNEARVFCEKASDQLASQLDRWRKGLAPKGLTWYPMFAAAPGPMAPPTPNVPCKLADLTSACQNFLDENALAMLLKQCLDRSWSGLYGNNDVGESICDGIARQLGGFFSDFSNVAQVRNVMGSGAVLGYAPPSAMVGPVHAQTLPAPGFIVPMPVIRPDR